MDWRAGGRWLELSPAADISSISSNGMMAVCVAHCRLGRLPVESRDRGRGREQRRADNFQRQAMTGTVVTVKFIIKKLYNDKEMVKNDIM